MSGGAIGGLVMGGIGLLAIIGMGIWWLYRKSKNGKEGEGPDDDRNIDEQEEKDSKRDGGGKAEVIIPARNKEVSDPATDPFLIGLNIF